MSENRSQKSINLSNKTASSKDITKQQNDNKKEDDPERKIKLGQIVSLMKATDKTKKVKEQIQENNQTEQSNNQITKTENKSTLSSSVYQDSINKE